MGAEQPSPTTRCPLHQRPQHIFTGFNVRVVRDQTYSTATSHSHFTFDRISQSSTTFTHTLCFVSRRCPHVIALLKAARSSRRCGRQTHFCRTKRLHTHSQANSHFLENFYVISTLHHSGRPPTAHSGVVAGAPSPAGGLADVESRWERARPRISQQQQRRCSWRPQHVSKGFGETRAQPQAHACGC